MPPSSREVLVLLQVLVVAVQCYHKPLSEPLVRLHCWPLDADEQNDETIDCQGLDLVWNVEPSMFVLQGDTIQLSANITATGSFLDSQLNGSGSGAEFCQKECPSDCTNVTSPEDCCVWHANLHVCIPLSDLCDIDVVCGPWVSNDSVISQHTQPQCGPLGTFTDQAVMNFPGVNTVIYHMQVGEIHIVLGTYVYVEADTCGDGTCQKRIEVCESCPDRQREDELDSSVCVRCPEDCCPFSIIIIIVTFFGSILFIVVFIPLIIVLCICTCVLHRRKKRMKDESWVISYNDIVIRSGKKAMSSLSSLNKKRDNSSGVYSSIQDLQALQIFTEIGTYNGRAVAIRRVRRTSSAFCSIPTKLRREVVQIRTLEHQNLCKFIGATVKDPPPNMAIISEYCSKGSLNDVLLNENVPLNWNFRFSFAGDIARGVAYLHSHGIIHGRLTSSNCVIDDRWVTKITDYGLPGLRHQSAVDESEQYQRNIPKVYRAPEVRDLGRDRPSTTTSADVYSYAIILFEVATRMDPRSEDTWQLDTNWKPRISQKDLSDSECPCPQDYLHLMNKCWTFSPQTRHTFDKIKKQLREINPSTTSAIDNMMLMMEKYSKHLEQLVEERTAELEVEQQRATDLLYRMIPQAVADELKHGKTISAETFSGATIFFSDIVGFTNLAGSSTPMEIVNLLNTLYTEFDAVLDQFDVYKVETIGDAYMVVSGVPKPNGDGHAGEIAKMALQLLGRCKTFTIPHRPETQLQIRAGIHSGSVCAGIVGVKMPRYCLFGDTVNTASRMESNSVAMKIQCSSATHALLTKLGGFTLEERGVIEVKGKGSMNTWWLVDYTEPDIVVLPPAREDAPLSPTTMEPIRASPKKYSVGDLRCSASSSSLTRGDSLNSTGVDLYKKHQSLQASSFSNLLAAEGGGERGAGEKVGQKRSITMPRESSKGGSVSELPHAKTSLTSVTITGSMGTRFSVPHIKVTPHPSSGRRVTQPNMETVGLGVRELQSRHSTSSRDHVQPAVTPLDNKHSTELFEDILFIS